MLILFTLVHYESEHDSFVERFKGSHLIDKEYIKTKPAKRSLNKGSIYNYGLREVYTVNNLDKRWWQQQFLPKKVQMEDIEKQMETINLIQSMKGEKAKEICDECGNDEAFFHVFQARSADEGSTIMYECTKCSARKVFNN